MFAEKRRNKKGRWLVLPKQLILLLKEEEFFHRIQHDFSQLLSTGKCIFFNRNSILLDFRL